HRNSLGGVEGDDVGLNFVKARTVAVKLAEQILDARIAELVDESRMIVRLDVLKWGDRESFAGGGIFEVARVAEKFRIKQVSQVGADIVPSRHIASAVEQAVLPGAIGISL